MNKIITRMKQPSTWIGLLSLGLMAAQNHGVTPQMVTAALTSLGLIAVNA